MNRIIIICFSIGALCHTGMSVEKTASKSDNDGLADLDSTLNSFKNSDNEAVKSIGGIVETILNLPLEEMAKTLGKQIEDVVEPNSRNKDHGEGREQPKAGSPLDGLSMDTIMKTMSSLASTIASNGDVDDNSTLAERMRKKFRAIEKKDKKLNLGRKNSNEVDDKALDDVHNQPSIGISAIIQSLMSGDYSLIISEGMKFLESLGFKSMDLMMYGMRYMSGDMPLSQILMEMGQKLMSGSDGVMGQLPKLMKLFSAIGKSDATSATDGNGDNHPVADSLPIDGRANDMLKNLPNMFSEDQLAKVRESFANLDIKGMVKKLKDAQAESEKNGDSFFGNFKKPNEDGDIEHIEPKLGDD